MILVRAGQQAVYLAVRCAVAAETVVAGAFRRRHYR
jgi:hypothetical protein